MFLAFKVLLFFFYISTYEMRELCLSRLLAMSCATASAGSFDRLRIETGKSRRGIAETPAAMGCAVVVRRPSSLDQ
jgi:hypothetical protein